MVGGDIGAQILPFLAIKLWDVRWYLMRIDDHCNLWKMGSFVSLYKFSMSNVAKKGREFGDPDSNHGDDG